MNARFVIRDARFLRDEFVPREVEHRETTVNHLSTVLEPLFQGERSAGPTILTGPSGAGKTCIARFTTDRLRRELLDLECQYVNCWQNYSLFRALYRILEGLGKTVDIHRQSTPRDELIERLRKYDGPPCVVVLDEVDQLEDKSILYDLYTLPQFSMILIANNEEEIFADAGERIMSRLAGSERIHFERYGVSELTAILAARAERGLREDAVTTAELEVIADAAAGDARFALSILRTAARRAQSEQVDRLTVERVREAIPNARTEVRQTNLDVLTPHQRTLYDIIADRGESEPSALYAAYRERVDDPKTDRTVRNYLQKMARYDLIVARGTSRDRVYRLPKSVSE